MSSCKSHSVTILLHASAYTFQTCFHSSEADRALTCHQPCQPPSSHIGHYHCSECDTDFANAHSCSALGRLLDAFCHDHHLINGNPGSSSSLALRIVLQLQPLLPILALASATVPTSQLLSVARKLDNRKCMHRIEHVVADHNHRLWMGMG